MDRRNTGLSRDCFLRIGLGGYPLRGGNGALDSRIRKRGDRQRGFGLRLRFLLVSEVRWDESGFYYDLFGEEVEEPYENFFVYGFSLFEYFD